MSRSRHAQVHIVVLLPYDVDQEPILVGTPSQRGFTELGARKAMLELNEKLGHRNEIRTLEVTPIDELV